MKLEYLNLKSTDPYFNLACEQFVFDCLPRDRSYIMLWQNDNTVVIGKYQNAYSEINAAYVREHNTRVARRLSGGGAVYHDLGNLNYTIITDAGDMEQLNMKLFCRPVVKALGGIGVCAEINGRNDMTIDGKKFSGNSQYIKSGRVMHHGTIMFDSDLSVLEKVLCVDENKISSKGIKSVRSRVTNVSEHISGKRISLSEFREMLLREMLENGDAREHELSNEETACINEMRGQYAAWEWNYGRSPECTVTQSGSFENCGRIDLFLTIKNGMIGEVSFRGDFFSLREPEELANMLRNTAARPRDIEAVLRRIEPRDYFHGIGKEDFIGFVISAVTG